MDVRLITRLSGISIYVTHRHTYIVLIITHKTIDVNSRLIFWIDMYHYRYKKKCRNESNTTTKSKGGDFVHIDVD